MTTYEQGVGTGAVADDTIGLAEEECAPKKPLWWRILKGTLIGVGVTIVLLVVTGVLLYNFGSMWLPDPQMKAEYGQLVAAGQAPAIEKRFTIPIPGCKCHSKDPVQTMQHTTYRISECNSCHGGGATMSAR
ncbi:MAG: hypothetical protein HY876_06825 [Coriobacteriales bacterium]|nr:hypothetical protein [Coriobacteriales bacterium]